MQTEPEQWAVELWEAADAAFDAWPDGNAHRASHAAALTIQRAFEERERGRINAAIETAKEAPPRPCHRPSSPSREGGR